MKTQGTMLGHFTVVYSVPHNCSYTLIIPNMIYELQKSVEKRIQDLTGKKKKQTSKSKGTTSFSVSSLNIREVKAKSLDPFFTTGQLLLVKAKSVGFIDTPVVFPAMHICITAF